MKNNAFSQRYSGRRLGQGYMSINKLTQSVKMKLLCLATLAMAMTSAQLAAQTFTTLHSFNGSSNEGFPWDSLILSGKSLYGTADGTNATSNGAVFTINTDGTGFTTLHSFTETIGSEGISGTNGDGAYPHAGLILSG